MKNLDLHFETRAIHAGQDPEKVTGAVMTPIFQTSTYAQKSPGEHTGYEYSRTLNPTRKALEDCVASLEKMKFGYAFGSGCAAASTLMHLYKAGDHIICTDDCYGGTYRLFDKIIRNNGVEFDFVDMSKPELVLEKVKKNTRALWVETPTNPMLKIIDLEKMNDIAKKKSLHLIVDNTFMSPYFQNPVDFGADIVLHSSTKYLNGHSDVVGGIVTVNEKSLAERIQYLQNAMGAIPGPMDSF